MKASRQAKLESQLHAAETELTSALVSHLPYTAQHGDPLFENSEFRHSHVPAHRVSEESERLYQLASESVRLRETIGLPVSGSVGQLFVSACRELANTADGNRRGPRQLASWLISELGT